LSCTHADRRAQRIAIQHLRVSVDRGWARSVRKPGHGKRATIAASFEQRPASDKLSFCVRDGFYERT